VKIGINSFYFNVYFFAKFPKSIVNTHKLKTVETRFFVAPFKQVLALHVGVAGAKAYRAAHVARRIAVAAD
jgi:hypothetical protein